MFLSLNGHLIAIDFFIWEFWRSHNLSAELPPLSLVGLGARGVLRAMFYTGGLILLPVVGALLMANIAIGVTY